MLAGEGIFVLPFILARIFRPTFLEIFELNNEQLGVCGSAYGIVALLSYLLGGSLADRYSPKILIAISLWITGASGIYFATFPPYEHLLWLYGFWGFSTIFLFWSALIKATRIWGKHEDQGKGFGWLDGGRGLVGAAFGLTGVFLLSTYSQVDITQMTIEDRRLVFQQIILTYSVLTILIGVGVFFAFGKPTSTVVSKRNPLSYYLNCIKIPAVWMLMIIILCAYVGYKTTDYFALYAVDIVGYDQIESSQLGTWMLALRAVTAVITGYLADRYLGARLLPWAFVILILGGFFLSSGYIGATTEWAFIFAMVFAGIGIFSVRTLYYAVMKEGNIPLIYTGTAVGIMSIVGYAPDIFFGPLTGWILDRFPGALGHQYVFQIMTAFGIVGWFTSVLFLKRGLRPEK